MRSISLHTPVSSLGGLFKRFLPALTRLGIKTVKDLLWHFPARYEDFSKITPVRDLVPGTSVTVRGKIVRISSRNAFRKGIRSVVEAEIEDDTGTVPAIWFNQPYASRSLKEGQIANFSGRVAKKKRGGLYLAQPAHETGARKTTHTARIVGVYPETRGITSKGLRRLVEMTLPKIGPEEWLPEEVSAKYDVPEMKNALREAHFPSSVESAGRARERFLFEELLLVHLANASRKMKLSESEAHSLHTDIDWLKGTLSGLPFELTESQKRSLWEIIKDIGRPHPMNRLLYGDVGSGKTVVAALAALIAAKNGLQSAFMAPTEILARQHFRTLSQLFSAIPERWQPPAGLLTSSEARVLYETDLETEVKKSDLAKKVLEGKLSIVVGTHTLIEKTIRFEKLGLVIVDEQHRFGVRQRAALLEKSGVVPHLLSMSATPIPRTLMLTVFGDLQHSRITELPKGRESIETTIVPPAKRSEVYDFVDKKLGEGRQAFVICPRISLPEENRSSHTQGRMETKAVEDEHKKLSEKIFPHRRIAALHGGMKSADKERIMNDFREGKTDILVSTSVVEVGVDIPNATIIMIEGSNRFGLAQLYQLRGRVGRGEHRSYCFLMTDSEEQTENARLQAIARAKNGLELAEEDLKLRGPGELLGEAQSGFSDLVTEALRHPRLVDTSRQAAEEILEKDPTLMRYPLLQERVKEFEKKVHRE